MPKQRKIPSVKVNFDTTNTNIGTGSFVCPWHSESYDTDGFWDGTSDYLVMPFSGLYLIAATISFLPTTSLGTFGFAGLQRDNGSAGAAYEYMSNSCWDQHALGTTLSINTHATEMLVKGERVRLIGQQNGGSGSDLRGSDSGWNFTFMTCALLDKYNIGIGGGD